MLDEYKGEITMKKIIKYNLEIMSVILIAVALFGIAKWEESNILRQMTSIFMILYTLHEWEEARFPGGFYKIFFSKCTIDTSVSEETMHFPVAIFLLTILLIPFIFDEVIAFALVPLILALFEGFVHTAGIILHQLKRPYSPGMITAWIMFAYSIIMINKLNVETAIGTTDWIIGIVLTIISFYLMETQFVKTVGITIRDFQKSMQRHVLSRIKKHKS